MGANSSTTQLHKARQLYEAENPESAVELLEPLVREPPTDHRAPRLLFKAYTELCQAERAERTYQMLLDAGGSRSSARGI